MAGKTMTLNNKSCCLAMFSREFITYNWRKPCGEVEGIAQFAVPSTDLYHIFCSVTISQDRFLDIK